MKKVLIIASCLLLAVVLSGCGEKAAEVAVETATGGQADVDIDNDTVTVNTNGSSFSAGEDVDLPSDFPSDVYVANGDITAVTTVAEGNGYSVSIQTEDTVEAVKEEYLSNLEAEGWTITMTLTIGDGVTIGAEKDNRTVSVNITEDDDGNAFVILGTSTNQG